jgi:hypothetical protein
VFVLLHCTVESTAVGSSIRLDVINFADGNIHTYQLQAVESDIAVRLKGMMSAE